MKSFSQTEVIYSVWIYLPGVVVAPHNNPQFTSGKQSLWIDQRWGGADTNDKDSSRSKTKLLTNHLSVDVPEGTDYAEVDPHNLTTFYNGVNGKNQQQILHLQQPDLTPYATTTLIQRRPNYVRFSFTPFYSWFSYQSKTTAINWDLKHGFYRPLKVYSNLP